MTELADLLDRAKLLKLSPGDTLVIELDADVSERQVAEIRERAEHNLPDNRVVIVAAGAVRVEPSYDILVQLSRMSDEQIREIGKRMSHAIARYRRHHGMRPVPPS